MAYSISPSKRVVKYLKKLKDKQLKRKFVDKIYNDIANDPYSGDRKHGDLKEFYAYGFNGSHEKFYEQLKRIAKN